ncbi:PQQ-dependent sugar dehydrogenase [Streptomyces sp. NPDC057638]|uniref:PQQ-dependent sugar dehydrogenase n=1 Tax=Streptomyces sp. NPDC057638 TaxID=3346190 RepID=UPI003698B8F5
MALTALTALTALVALTLPAPGALAAGPASRATVAGSTPARATALAPIRDPIPQKPLDSGLGLTVEEYAAFPRTQPVPGPVTDARLRRHARINHLGEVPGRPGRMAVPDLNGRLYLTGAARPPTVYLDVAAAIGPAFFASSGLGSGLGFVAFPPDHARTGRFYTVHTERAAEARARPDFAQSPSAYHGVITEWTATDPAAEVFAGSRREILRIGFTGGGHGIQQIDVNPTARPGDTDHGLLYVAVGDGARGAGSGDPQNLSVPHGKLLRIDPRGTDSASGRYGVPRQNPFTGRPGALGEIYAYGMRDPHRFSWDAVAPHRLYLGHIGEHAIESVYEVRAGDNLGWTEREGPFVYDRRAENPCDRLLPLPADDARHGYTYPVAAYDHDPPPGWNCRSDVGRAIAGGHVYRGSLAPALYGMYLYADIVDGRVFFSDTRRMERGSGRLADTHTLALVDRDGRTVTARQLAGHPRVDLRLGRDAQGELYLLSKANGRIWKVTGVRGFADCRPEGTTLAQLTDAAHWAPVTPAKWRFPPGVVTLAEPGAARPGPRRPFEYAVLTAGPRFGRVEIDAEVRLDTPVEITNRDVILVLAYQSDTRFAYVHLSSDHTIYPHNGIFVVDGADRVRVDHQWNGSTGAPPAIRDAAWHRVRVVHCAESGQIAVYVDGSARPLMTAVDRTFTAGRVGFGSFDNVGSLRALTVRGRPEGS